MATPGLGGDPYASLSQGRGGGLRVFGLDRAGLEAAGIDVRSTRRLYRGLYVHGLALHRLVSGEASGVVNGGALVLRLMVGYRALLSALDADGGGGGSGELAPRGNAAVVGRTDTEAEVNPGDLLAGMEYAAGEQERALADRGAWDLRMQLMQKAVQAERTKLKKANSEHGETRAVVRDLEAELESSQVDVAHERAISRRLREEAERVKQRYTDSLDEWKGRFESEKLAHHGRQQQLQANLEAHGKLERRHHQLESLLAAKKAEAAQLEDANNALERDRARGVSAQLIVFGKLALRSFTRREDRSTEDPFDGSTEGLSEGVARSVLEEVLNGPPVEGVEPIPILPQARASLGLVDGPAFSR